MIPFAEHYPDLAERETRSLLIKGRSDLPDGDYGFVELFCDEPDCDCRRVMIDVLRRDTGWSRIWATINYGWENLAFYRRWGGRGVNAALVKGPFLDPLNPQTPYSAVLLTLFGTMLQSADYIERLRTHYQMFRTSVVDVADRHPHISTPRRTRGPSRFTH